MKSISTIVVVIVGILVLVYLSIRAVSEDIVPFPEILTASSTEQFLVNDIDQVGVSSETLSEGTPKEESTDFIPLRTSSTLFNVSVAKTPETREKGLSGKRSLAVNEGLLFIFPEEGRHSFWMKDMNFPIDIVWIDSSGIITEISENISPNTYPQTFLPMNDVQFVLELVAGAAEKFGIKEGTTVTF